MYIFKVLLSAISFSLAVIHQSVYLHVLFAFVLNVSVPFPSPVQQEFKQE